MVLRYEIDGAALERLPFGQTVRISANAEQRKGKVKEIELKELTAKPKSLPSVRKKTHQFFELID